MQTPASSKKHWVMMTEIASPLSDMNVTGEFSGIIYSADYAGFLEDYAELAYLTGDTLLAEALLQTGLQHATTMVKENPGLALSHTQLLQLVFQYWQQNGSLPDPDAMELLDGKLPAKSMA